MKDILPEVIRTRRDKTNLQPAFAHGFKKYGLDHLQRAICDKKNILEPYADMQRLKHILNAYLSGNGNSQYEFTLFRFMSLSQWLDDAISK